MTTQFYRLGAHYSPAETTFTVWSPLTDTMDVHLIRTDEYIPMNKDEQGYFSCTIANIRAGDTYLYRINH
ncbi:MAG: hypothetical protein KJ043_19995, partial [Anaerolineae bacterium]|nr:hypothetical protein [Anaerolineae bacterium]